MQIKVKIDQKACLSKGLDAPLSYYLATISPVTLPVEVRTWLGQHMLDEITVSCISFHIPKPTQGDIEQKILKQIRIEQEDRKNEQTAIANLLKLLNEEQQWLFKTGLLPDEVILKSIALEFHPKLEVLNQTLAPKRVITALQLWIPQGQQDKSTATLVWHADQTHDIQYNIDHTSAKWHDAADATWIPFIKTVETAGYKVLKILGQEDSFKVEIHPAAKVFPVQVSFWVQIKSA